MIVEENTVNLNIIYKRIEHTSAKNTIKITTETVKLTTKPGKTVAKRSTKRRSLI